MTDVPSEWTVDTLRAHVEAMAEQVDHRCEARFKAQEQALQVAMTSAEKAVNAALAASNAAVAKAEIASEKRFDAVNEFRGQLTDQANTFVTRAESDANLARLSERIQDLTDRLNRSEGHNKGQSSTWAAVVTASGVLIALGGFILLLVTR